MPKHALLTRDNSVPLETRDAIPRPQTFDATNNTVEAVIASGTPVQRRDARGDYLEILAVTGLDLAATRGASVLDSHNANGLDAVLGTIADVRIDGDEVIARIQFSTRPEVAPVIEDIRSGIISHLSVGYRVEHWRDGHLGRWNADQNGDQVDGHSWRGARGIAVGNADAFGKRQRAAAINQIIHDIGGHTGALTKRPNLPVDFGPLSGPAAGDCGCVRCDPLALRRNLLRAPPTTSPRSTIRRRSSALPVRRCIIGLRRRSSHRAWRGNFSTCASPTSPANACAAWA
jgi:hypothetical protein